MRLFTLLFFLFSLVCCQVGFAQSPTGEQALEQLMKANPASPSSIPIPEQTGFSYPDLTTQAAILVFLALLPFLVMLLTSFLKMVITLSLLRSALGVQQTPPNTVINGIALILSIYVMYPTGYQMVQKAKPVIALNQSSQLFSANTAGLTFKIIDEAKEPLRDFLIRNAKSKHIESFYKLAMKSFPDEVKGDVKETDFIIVVPAFITTQIRAAFEIGVLIYLPFFVIDLVTSNILLAMQMMMLSPLSISLPLKLLLLVMIDGWTILLQGLVLSFN